MEKRWKILNADLEKTAEIQQVLKINKNLCKILINRGIDTYEKAECFFRPKLSMLHSPWLMKDMDKAVERITTAIKSEEKIMVFGDYDVDGTTSVASMYLFLSEIHPEIEYYIPHREKEGYGISKKGIDYANENNFSLIISLDCGIKSIELVDYANTLGIDFIICDHHLPDTKLPEAVAILNPKQNDCQYPYKELCGCGIGFKLMTALAITLDLPDESYLQYLDLLATAIAADIVPMTGENRVMTYFGLQKINRNPSNGIKALMQLAGAQKEMFNSNLVFIIAPRINAAGRMDDAKKAVELFIEKDYAKACSLAELLHNDNKDRRTADSNITEEALSILIDENLTDQHTTVLYREHWHKGVIGIVASRLIESYYRPTIVLTKSGNIAAGSARSVAGFNLYEAIHACKDYLIGYGGHFAAAGMTLLPENVPAFSKKFEEIVRQTIHADSLIPELIIDAEISFSELTLPLYKVIRQMEPFGPQNLRPVFVVRNVTDSGQSKILKEKHIRFCLKQNNTTLTGIGFNMAEKFSIIETKKPLDVVFSLEENEWNGQISLQLKVHDFRLSDSSLLPQ